MVEWVEETVARIKTLRPKRVLEIGFGTGLNALLAWRYAEDNNVAVRKMLMERSVKPEDLPPAEDLKKVQRRLEGEEKKIVKEAKKLNGKAGK